MASLSRRHFLDLIESAPDTELRSSPVNLFLHALVFFLCVRSGRN